MNPKQQEEIIVLLWGINSFQAFTYCICFLGLHFQPNIEPCKMSAQYEIKRQHLFKEESKLQHYQSTN